MLHLKSTMIIICCLLVWTPVVSAGTIPFISPIAGSIDEDDILGIEVYDYTDEGDSFEYLDFYLDLYDFTNSTAMDLLLTFTVSPIANSNLNPWLALFEEDTVPTTTHYWAQYDGPVPITPDLYDIMLASSSGNGSGVPNSISYTLAAGDSIQLVVTTNEYHLITYDGIPDVGPDQSIFGDYILTATYEVNEPRSMAILLFGLIVLMRSVRRFDKAISNGNR